MKPNSVQLRDVYQADLDIFFEQQRNPEAIRMAAFTSKDPDDRQAFDQKWLKMRNDDTLTVKTILAGTDIAGNILKHNWFGDSEISYWLGREFWGRGIATEALRKFLQLLPDRPLFARVVFDNAASARILEKNGFVVHGSGKGFAQARGCEIDEFIYVLK